MLAIVVGMLAVGCSSRKSIIVLARLRSAFGVLGLLRSVIVAVLRYLTQIVRALRAGLLSLLPDDVRQADERCCRVTTLDVEPADVACLPVRGWGWGPDPGMECGLSSALTPLPLSWLVDLDRCRLDSAPDGVRVRVHEEGDVGHLGLLQCCKQVRARHWRQPDLGLALASSLASSRSSSVKASAVDPAKPATISVPPGDRRRTLRAVPLITVWPRLT